MGETDVTPSAASVTSGSSGTGTTDDGRTRSPRAARTRRTVVDALLALLEEGNLRPTAREVADRANVSLRSVYVHFDDVEALFLAAAVRHEERMQQLRTELVTTGTFEERLQAFVERRAGAYEVAANVRRAAVLQEPFSPALRDALKIGRQVMRSQIDDVFGQDMAGAHTDRRKLQRAELIVATTPTTWDDLRVHQGLSAEEAKTVMADMIRSILDRRA